MTSATSVIACRECGKADEAHYMDPTRARMLKDQLCFNDLFWTEALEEARDPKVAIVKGNYYVVSPYVEKRRPGQVLGFGGDLFLFRFKDGRTARSNNVFTKGKIPAHWRKRLPDNAVLLDSRRSYVLGKAITK